MMRVLVCGGRQYSDRHTLFSVLDVIHQEFGIDRIINGAATGADDLSTEWAKTRKVPFQLYSAEWKKYRRSAGMIRNQLMYKDSEPDMVVAFPGGVGTANMVDIVVKSGFQLFLDSPEVKILIKTHS
jgi:hypothetical protein